ncbi:hypothetical protein Q8A67_025120 [Cirrhinus molitorella]|uniref:Uncharacterized protein n=1 Tax=Cirrhinus molitorella TaxID=172907 RepID=A0AA88P7S1_9TELE|nr:hypothetical protein Q8A67_025120 [Cirrhinus molitorella]
MEPRRMGLHATFGNLHTYLHFRAAQLLSVSGAAGLSRPHWQAEVHLSGPVRPRLPRREMDVNSLRYLYHAETVLKPTYDSRSLCCYNHPNVEREREWHLQSFQDAIQSKYSFHHLIGFSQSA